MKYFILSIVFSLIAAISYAQRPMPLDQIIPKIDSIEVEADKLYHYIKAEKAAIELLKEGKSNVQPFASVLTYARADSFASLVAFFSKGCKYNLPTF